MTTLNEQNAFCEESEKAADSAAEVDISFDIVINGGTFSAPSAALQAARTNPTARILLMEPTDWLGGQATSQGVSAIDNAYRTPAGPLMLNYPETYYPADYLDFLQRMKDDLPGAPGEGMAPNGSAWVSREAYDPRTAAWVLDQMVAEFPNITLMKMTVVKEVTTTDITDDFGPGKVITGLKIIQRSPINGYTPFDKFLSEEITDWYDPNDSADFAKTIYNVTPSDPLKGLVLVDTSELADVIVLSGSRYTVGRESVTEVIADDGTLPAMDEDGTQAFVYPFCMTDASVPESEDALKTDFPDFDTYYQDQKNNYFSMGSHSWNRIWTYRRLKNTGAVWAFDSVNLGDVTMQNWYPGNDYPYGSFLKPTVAAAAESSDWYGGVITSHLADAEKHAVAWYFYMKENKTTAWDTHYLRGSDSLNMMGTATGLSKFPYIRGTRRMVGFENFRITERYFVEVTAADYDGGTSYRYYDSVGIGNYPADIHPSWTSTGISPTKHTPAPFYIPYRSLASANVRNLLAGGKSLATTYISNSAYRLHPIEWVIGSADGAAAGLMARDGKPNSDLLDLPALRELQNEVNANSPISWDAFDAAPVPDKDGEIIVNDFNPVVSETPFLVEIYCHRAVRAEVFLLGVFIGETTTRINGRLVYEVASAPEGSSMFTAVCYDSEGNELCTLGVDIEALNIIDNEDSRFSTTGAWTRATAQPNKFGTSYDYSIGGSGENTATWEPHTPVSGTYEVAIWYPEAYNRATDSPFTIHHSGGQDTVRINQQEMGGQWLVLGQFFFDSTGENKVVLTNDISDTSLLVLADAVKTTLIASDVENWDSD